MEELELSTVRIKLRTEDEARVYDNAISWAIIDGIASVRVHEEDEQDRLVAWPVDMIEEWDVPFVPAPQVSEQAMQQQQQPQSPQPQPQSVDEGDWFGV